MTAPVFLSPLTVGVGERLRLDGAEGRHAALVRRLTVGEAVVVTNGLGRRHAGIVAAVGKDVVDVDVQEAQDVPAPSPRLVVVQALPKGDRGELAVELLTEVGVDEIVPWSAERCVTQWRGDKIAKATEKWRATARESTKQSRRSWAPVVSDLASTREVCARLAAARLALVLHESATEPLSTLDVPGDGEVVLVIGPEGSLSEAELQAFLQAGATVRRMGDSVMRTSTAGAVAASVISARTSRWG
ncbi:MAG: rRNA (uracil1498-N3)-methyltransferase [Frankiaceae bacterium]|nr:rRNA (uracil1498-N3)-methyltransferase [Frankiaceae bacterium]